MPAMQIEELKCSFFLLLAHPSSKMTRKSKKKDTQGRIHTQPRGQNSKASTVLVSSIEYSIPMTCLLYPINSNTSTNHTSSASKYIHSIPSKLEKDKQTSIRYYNIQTRLHLHQTYCTDIIIQVVIKYHRLFDQLSNTYQKKKKERLYRHFFFLYTASSTSKYLNNNIGYDT